MCPRTLPSLVALSSCAVFALGCPGSKPPGDKIKGVTWVKNIGHAEADRVPNDVAELVEDDKPAGYAVVGTTGNGASWVAKLDTSGDVVWSSTFGGRPNVQLKRQRAMTQSLGNGVVVAGEGPDARPMVVELDASGAVLRTKSFSDDLHTVHGMTTHPFGYTVVGSRRDVAWAQPLGPDLEPVAGEVHLVDVDDPTEFFAVAALDQFRFYAVGRASNSGLLFSNDIIPARHETFGRVDRLDDVRYVPGSAESPGSFPRLIAAGDCLGQKRVVATNDQPKRIVVASLYAPHVGSLSDEARAQRPLGPTLRCEGRGAAAEASRSTPHEPALSARFHLPCVGARWSPAYGEVC